MAITEGAICAISGAAGSVISVSSASFDSTGGGGLLFMVVHEGAPTSCTWSDNKSTGSGNFVSLGTVDANQGGASGDLSLSCVFAYSPNVGTGHTVTATFGAARAHRYIGGVVINGTFSATFLAATTQTATFGNSVGTVDAGSLVTDAAAYLIHFAGNYNADSINSAGGGWAIKSNATVGRHFQARNESAAGTFDPSFTLLNSNPLGGVTLAAAIKETEAVEPGPAPTLHVIRSGIRLR